MNSTDSTSTDTTSTGMTRTGTTRTGTTSAAIGGAAVVRADVVVVGAGLAGLAAAATAARAGSDVVVLDARSPGGRARSVERDGYVLNDGAHALYQAGPGAAVLRELGVTVTGGSPPLDRYRTWWDGRVEPLPLTARGLLTTRLLSARSKMAAGGLLANVKKLAKDAGDVTFGEWLDDRGVRSDLRKLMEVVTRLVSYSAAPLDVPAATILHQLAVSSGGVQYLDGGWATLVRELLRVATAAGARVVTDAPVTAVQRDGADWVVQSEAAVVAAPSVVLAAGGPATAEALVGRRVGWVETAGPAVRVACLDIGTTAVAPVEYLFSADDPLYLSQHAPPARLAPDGHRLCSLMRYVRTGEQLDRVTARAELEEHAARAGLPPSGDGRTLERFLASMPVAWGSPTVGLPRPRGDELAGEGIHVAGDWVGDSLLADAALESGARAGRAVAQRTALVA